MGFQVSADALEAPIQFNNVFPVGLENIGIKVVRISDLSEAEQDEIMAEYNAEQLRRLCRYLSMSLRQIGDALDLVRDE